MHHVDVQIHGEPTIQSQTSHTSASTGNTDDYKTYQEDIDHEIHHFQQKPADEFPVIQVAHDGKSSRSTTISSMASQSIAHGVDIQQVTQSEDEEKSKSSRSSSKLLTLENQMAELKHIYSEEHGQKQEEIQHLGTENRKSYRSSTSSSAASHTDEPDSTTPKVSIFSRQAQHTEVQWSMASQSKTDRLVIEKAANTNDSSRFSNPFHDFGQATITSFEFENWSTVEEVSQKQKSINSSTSSESDHQQEFPPLPPLPTCPPPDDSLLTDEGVHEDFHSEGSLLGEEDNVYFDSKATNFPHISIKFPTDLLKHEHHHHHQESTDMWLEENEKQMERMEADRWELFETSSSTNVTHIHRQQEHTFIANEPSKNGHKNSSDA